MHLPKKRDTHKLAIDIEIDVAAYQKFMCWVDIAKGEVSALGLVEESRDENNGRITGLLVTDFFLVKQKCTAEETEMDEAGVAELMLRLESEGIDSGMLRCWAHSHGVMGVFWSGTDEACIDNLANDEWLLSLVVNKRGDTLMRLDQYHPCHFYMDNIDWQLRFPPAGDLEKACFSEFREKVTENRPILPTRKQKVPETVDELQAAYERGALTSEELEEEFDWLGWREELEDYPF